MGIRCAQALRRQGNRGKRPDGDIAAGPACPRFPFMRYSTRVERPQSRLAVSPDKRRAAMDYRISIEERPGHLFVSVWGRNTTESITRYSNDVREACMRLRHTRV